MVERRFLSSGSAFEEAIGYSRAVIEGPWVFVSGTTGFDYKTMTIAEDVESQTHQAFRNIEETLQLAGSHLNNVVRVRYYLREASDWPRIVPLLARYMRAARPAATALICALIDPRIRIEIEVTATRSLADER